VTDATDREAALRAAHIGGLTPLADGRVRLVDYDPEWPRLFVAEAARVRSALGARVVQLEHVGSTSVPGLSAKPIVDMLLVVDDSSDEAAYVPLMEAAGYRLHIREPDWFEHRLFKGPGTAINLHVFARGCTEIERMLRFRNWLRTHPEDRALYARTKLALAQRTWKYTQDYADAKTDIVNEIVGRATAAHAAPPAAGA
jgi:GrpB-like predicted nucleotidyltransferase (UPF0157 family)